MGRDRAPLRPVRLWCVAIALLSAASISLAAQRASNTHPTPKPADLQAVDARIAAMRNWIHQARNNEAATTKSLREAETELGAAHKQLAALNSEAHALAYQEANLLRRIGELDAQRTQLAERAAAHLRMLQRLGSGEPARVMLMLENPTDTPRVMTYYGYLQRARQHALQALTQNSTALRAAQTSLTQQQQALAEKKKAVEAESARMQQLHETRSTALAALQGDIGERDAELKRLRAERAELQSLLASLARPKPGTQEVLPPGTPFMQAKGHLPWPTNGTVAAHFGATKENTTLKWEGLLIDAAEGTDVNAVHQGQVAFTGWMRGLGTILILDHGNGFMSLYAHLNSVNYHAGDKINAGAALGQVGMTGGRTSAALYFEIRRRGSPVNPSEWLARR